MKLWSVGQIAERFGVRSHRVRYVVRVGGIEPEVVVAHYRGYSDQAVAAIGRALVQTPRRAITVTPA